MFEYRHVDHGWPEEYECVVIRYSSEYGCERFDYKQHAWVQDVDCWYENVMFSSNAEIVDEVTADAIIRRFS